MYPQDKSLLEYQLVMRQGKQRQCLHEFVRQTYEGQFDSPFGAEVTLTEKR